MSSQTGEQPSAPDLDTFATESPLFAGLQLLREARENYINECQTHALSPNRQNATHVVSSSGIVSFHLTKYLDLLVADSSPTDFVQAAGHVLINQDRELGASLNGLLYEPVITTHDFAVAKRLQDARAATKHGTADIFMPVTLQTFKRHGLDSLFDTTQTFLTAVERQRPKPLGALGRFVTRHAADFGKVGGGAIAGAIIAVALSGRPKRSS